MKKSNVAQREKSEESILSNVESEEIEKKNDKEKEDSQEYYGEYYAIVPPNGGWGWVVVFSAFYCNVVVDGIQLTFGIFLKAISNEFRCENSQIALAGSLMFGIHLLMGPVTSGCNAVFGLRPVTIAGSLICCFGVAISYFANGPWFLYFTFGLIGGMGLGMIYMNTLVITSLYFTTLMPVAIAIVVCGTGIGTMIFAGLGEFLLIKTNWRTSFLIEAAMASSMGLVAITFKPLVPIRVRIAGSSTKVNAPVEDSDEETHYPSSSMRTSIFIKTENPPRGSIVSVRTYHSLAMSFADNVDPNERKKKNEVECREWLKCCRKKKVEVKEEEREVLVLKEMKKEAPQTHRKSYVEMMEEEEIIRPETKKSSMSYKTVYTRFDINTEKKGKKFWKNLKYSMITMLDCRLLSSCSFFMFTVSGAVSLAAFLIVFIYEKDRCEEDFHYSETMSGNFIIALGGLNVFWRLVLGLISVIPKINYWALTISGMAVGGVGTMVSGYNSNVYYQIGFCFLFTLAMASFAVFRIPLLLDMVGLEFMENATGINLLFMGLLCIIFPPIFGWIKEASHSYNVIFMLTGAFIVVSAFMLICMKKVDVNKIKSRNILPVR